MRSLLLANTRRRIAAFSLCAVVFIIGNPVRADGLVFQLPKDGHFAKYDMELARGSGGAEDVRKATLVMSSVGEVKDGDTASRWIEIKFVTHADSGDRAVIAKVLIPEKHLKRGENSMAHFTKGWLKMGDSAVEAITDAAGPKAGPLPVFLSGPPDGEKNLEALQFESVLGKLECEGVSGMVTVDDGNVKVTVALETRLHPQAPFGVVGGSMKFQTSRNGEVSDMGTIRYKLVEIGENATTELPDHN